MTTELNKVEEEALRKVFQEAYLASLPSEALCGRIEALADGMPRAEVIRRGRARRTKLRFAGVCATALLVGILLLLPRLNAVLALTRMADSLRDVRSVHSVQWRVLSDGKRVKAQEQWYQAGNWHIEELEYHSTQICNGGKRWVYSSAENTVTLEHESAPIGYQGMTGFSVTAGLRDALAMGVLTDVKMLGSASLHGRAVHWMQITDNKYPDARTKVAVEDATGLPLQSETEVRTHGARTQIMVGESEYNLPLAQSLFTPNFPKTARLIDVEAGRDVWRQKLARGIASQTRGNDGYTLEQVMLDGRLQLRMVPLNGPRQVVIRDFQTNKNGDVFLLFTNGTGVGSGDNVLSADLTDEAGTKYISSDNRAAGPPSFTATGFNFDPQNRAVSKIEGYTFNKEQLVGRWWVPVNLQQLGKPHHFTLTLHEDFNPGVTVFHLLIEKPACAVVPEYMPYMARPLMDGWEIPHAEATTRGEYYAGEGHDLPQALDWYQKATAIDKDADRKIGGHYTEDSEWFAIYQIQSQLGKTEEAKTALLNANQDAVYAGQMRDKIRAEMSKLGISP